MFETGRFNGSGDGMWFSCCFVAGLTLLVFLRWPSLLNFSATVAALCTCGVIGFYAYAMWYWGLFRLRRDDRAADNLYYLGFLFTVCALGISLYRFSVAGDGRVAEIVGDLGVGLSPTVLGLFLRVLFLQREDPMDIEDRVQRELIDVAEATVARVRQTGAVVEQGQILTRQTIDELNETTRQCSSELTERMGELHRRVDSTVAEATASVPELVGDAELRLTAMLARFEEGSERLIHGLDRLGTALERTRRAEVSVRAAAASNSAGPSWWPRLFSAS